MEAGKVFDKHLCRKNSVLGSSHRFGLYINPPIYQHCHFIAICTTIATVNPLSFLLLWWHLFSHSYHSLQLCWFP